MSASDRSGDPSQDLREWIEPDDLGGFAMGPVSGVRTRRYHTLLTTATTPPTGRVALVAGLEAWLETADGSVALSTQRYAPGVLHPDGAQRLTGFAAEPWPTWRYVLADGRAILQELFCEPSSAQVVLRWRLEAAEGAELVLALRPLLAVRDYHALQRENPAFRFDAEIVGSNVAWNPYCDRPAVTALSNGAYEHAPLWYRHFLYAEEQARGLDAIEDLASPGIFRFRLVPNAADSADDPRDDGEAVLILRPGAAPFGDAGACACALRTLERTRRSAFPDGLARAADAYRVRRGTGRTILAGFPWFTDWGRDTFIALRGLCIAGGRLREARAILGAWASTVDAGMLPNRFPDVGEAPEYNSVDASLWYVIAVGELLDACAATGVRLPEAERARLLDATLAIIDGYANGTRFGIRADADGLIAAGEPGVQLTWMDAKVGDLVITPRIGKPVEVQALWINALRFAERWRPSLAALRARATASFLIRFPRPDGSLCDVVDADHVPGRDDASFRPNQIFAVGGLPLVLLPARAARRLVAVVEDRLWTPLGLRSLEPSDPRYRGVYEGGVSERDGAYHQGTVWPWLAGPFIEAWLRTRPGTRASRAEARRRFFEPLHAQLGSVGLGHLPEIADGDPPHHPRGAPFQAWSLGELMGIRRLLDDPPATNGDET